MNNPDRRVKKTQNAIIEAFNELLREKKYTNITVQEIIDRANVGRTTFYAHFPTKDDLLSRSVESVFESFNSQLMEHTGHNYENHIIPVTSLFEHMKENERMVRGVIMSESGDLLLEKLKKYWSVRIEANLLTHAADTINLKIPFKLLMNQIANTLICLIRYWLQNTTAYTPEQMENYFYSMIIPVVQFSIGSG